MPTTQSVLAKAAVTEDIKKKVEFVAGGNPEKPTATDVYQGTAHSVREDLFKDFNRTHKYFEYARQSMRVIVLHGIFL
jgi:hypothetical protein